MITGTLAILVMVILGFYFEWRINQIEKILEEEMMPRLNQVKGLYSKIEELKPKGDTNE